MNQILQRSQPPAVVVSAGKMQKTVKVRLIKQEWNKKLRKYFDVAHHRLVHDPTSALVAGDVIQMEPSRYSRHVKLVVSNIVSPFGTPVSERPPLLTAEQRQELYLAKRKGKVERRAQRGVWSAICEADERGWTVGVVDAIKAANLARKAEKGVAGGGREPLPGGHTKFGKINEEAREGGKKVVEAEKRGVKHEERLEEVEQRDAGEVARSQLQSDTGRRVDKKD